MAFLDETGLTHLWSKITNKFLAKSNVANNLTTTSAGYALDARQGATLMNAINSGGSGMKLSGNLITKTQSKGGTTTITLEKDAFCSFFAQGSYDFSDVGKMLIASVSVNGTDICCARGTVSIDKQYVELTASAFMVLPKGTTITLTAEYSNSDVHSQANAIIQYFE